MSMYSVLGSALAGMKATQSGLSLVAHNVANADTPGYTRKLGSQTPLIAGDKIIGVRSDDITRQIDMLVQRQLQSERSGAGYASTVSRYYEHMDALLGAPGSPAALDSLFNTFRSSLESLTSEPDSFSVRDQVLRDAQALAQTLNQTSEDIQAMRLDAEKGIGNAVEQINNLLGQISRLNQEIGAKSATGAVPADLYDVRDNYVSQLSGLIDIRVTEREHGQISISTGSGAQLLDLQPSELIFDERGSMTPQSLYSSNEDERGVGTIRVRSPNGLVIDFIEDRSIRSGELAALIELRDEHLVTAQSQLDALADSMARALSGREVEGQAATDGAQEGFDLDVSGLLDGDRITMTFSVGGVEQRVSIVRVDDPASLPLDDAATADPNDTVIGVDFSNGLGDVAAAINAALGPEIEVQDMGGDVLRFLDDGAAATSDIGAVTGQVTATGFQDGGYALPVFVDGSGGGTPYTGSLSGTPQQVGFAGRITINPDLLDDNSKLVTFAADTYIGDPARPIDLMRRLTQQPMDYAPSIGVNGSTPYQGTVANFVQRVVSHQAAQANDAHRSKESQDIVVAQLEERFTRDSGVNIDQEMAHLIELQTAYQANTRVFQAYREMMTMLLQM